MEWKIKDETGRLDVFLAKKIDLTRSKIQKLIKEEKIHLQRGKNVSVSNCYHLFNIVYFDLGF